ncbi:Ser/Thr protein phosphatase, putative [Trichomonas vaginalis G3]|uniref:Serine/threonine-protein phosphatase n=1 Tax=Trichomonas vaginalis (strain ATCC PRA-98 / G3) TaxID=412133 RepID=A2EZB1_TRIV3|nr:phosphoprotein phosphatase protein [Trichomonas vaginalis G3]EAY01992.1 Ser/Thr protein phosphatase, putative [Trichomonas vaginalis G3]KAI5546435.1 phosphoprotein phosphatase protein [Trichomonas vaginalis G3]|eukprot:XP_001330472.1 Ser/Thr protein phosphatase [Trichomonas vaginalis G3]
MSEGGDFDPVKMLNTFFGSHDRIKYFPFVYIPESYIIELCNRIQPILLEEPSIINLELPINVCGDTHGQFTDVLRIFDNLGMPGEKQYLFLGDYVDRGSQSVENIIFLLTLKYVYPKKFWLIRGNHETEEISTVYGFRDEVVRRYNFALYAKLLRVFDALPFCAIIANQIFCVHGGIPDANTSLDDIKNVKRPTEVTDTSPVIDILWSDPGPETDGFRPSPRGVSFIFGGEEAKKFMKKNNFSIILRSHEFCPEGTAFPFGQKGGFITVFSASNYCRTMNSSAALSINEKMCLRFCVFTPESNEKQGVLQQCRC